MVTAASCHGRAAVVATAGPGWGSGLGVVRSLVGLVRLAAIVLFGGWALAFTVAALAPRLAEL
ncbi:MAG: hypothetical protein ACO3PD_11040 [Acidimicrobiales bacterium]